MSPAAERAAPPFYQADDRELPAWAQADPHVRLQQVATSLTNEAGYAVAVLTTFDADEGVWTLEALSVAGAWPDLAARLESSGLVGRRMALSDAHPSVGPDGAPLPPEVVIPQQLADLLDPLIARVAPRPAIRVWLTVPLWVGERLLGTLTAGATSDEPSEAQRELLQAYAGQAVLTLANIELWERAYESLQRTREARRRYHNLLESSIDAVFLLDPQGRFAYLNRQAEALSGYSREELYGHSFLRLVPESDRPEWISVAQKILAGESLPFILEMTLLARQGRPIPVEISITALRTAGALEGVQILARDIRERRQHELERERLLEESREMSRRLHVSFHQIGAALAQSRNVGATLRLIVRFAAEMLDAEGAYLWLLPAGGERPALEAGYCPAQGADDAAPADPQRAGAHCAAQVLAEQRVLHLSAGEESRVWLGVPMAVDGRPLGALLVARRPAQPFSPAEKELLTSFAHQASVAIERARLFENLLQEKTECETVVHNSADGIMVLDPERRVIDANPALERLLGYERSYMVGRHCWEIMGDLAAGEPVYDEKCPFHPDWTQGTSLSTHRIRRRDGQDITVSVSYGLVHDSQGNLSRVIAILRDMTKQAELEQLRRDFISSVSHELRTPLALIKGYVGTLMRRDIAISEEVRQRFLSNINGAVDRLDRLIDDLLTASRIEAGRLSMEYRSQDLAALTRRVVEGAGVQYPDRQIELELADAPLLVHMDADRIEQVLSNLISNAVKFSPPGRPIRVRAERAGEMARVSVTDQGAGISLEHQQHLFEKFYRVEAGLARQTPGLGLGLHIAKGIIEAHGGHIWVRSRPGQGSTFGFDLPLATQPNAGIEPGGTK